MAVLSHSKAVMVYPDPPEIGFKRTPLRNQIEAWIVADTLAEELGKDRLAFTRYKTLHRMALDLADWLEERVA